jgi:predicted enzyme related to lactoylglutathione lyase
VNNMKKNLVRFLVAISMLLMVPVVSMAKPGQPVWLDLLTDKPAEAVSFYAQVFGWKFEPDSSAGGSMISYNGHSLGSVVATEESFQVGDSLWLLSLATDDLVAEVDNVTDNGGNLIDGPGEKVAGERYAVVADAQGAPFVLLEGADASAMPVAEDLNTWVWGELWTSDIDAAVRFYRSMAPYDATAVETGLNETYTVLSLSNTAELGVVQSPWADMPAVWVPYVLVADVSAIVSRALQAGALLVVPPLDGNGGVAAILMDPTGGVFGVQQEWVK